MTSDIINIIGFTNLTRIKNNKHKKNLMSVVNSLCFELYNKCNEIIILYYSDCKLIIVKDYYTSIQYVSKFHPQMYFRW